MKLSAFLTAVGLSLLCSGCSIFQPSCDSAEALFAVREMVAGIEVKDNREADRWLANAVSVTVLNQTSDDSGRRVACEATVTLASSVMEQADGLLGLMLAMGESAGKSLTSATIHYNVSKEAFSGDQVIILTPKSDAESAFIKLSRTILGPAFKQFLAVASLPATKPSAAAQTQEKQNGEVSLASTLTPDIFGMNREFLEGKIGRPKYSNDKFKTYEISGCEVNITYETDQSVKSFDLPASTPCSFDLMPFLGGNGTRSSHSIKMADAAELLSAVPTWNCISVCGNVEPTTFYLVGGGGKPSNYADIVVSSKGDFGNQELRDWSDAVSDPCDAASRNQLMRILKDQLATRIEIGWDVSKELMGENFQGCKS